MPPPPPEPVAEPIQSATIVILQPGSFSLRLGRATDAYPQSVPHCIARRHKQPGQLKPTEDVWMCRPEGQYPFLEATRIQGLNTAQESLGYRPMAMGTYRKAANTQQLARVNHTKEVEETDVPSPFKWTDTSHKPEKLFGDQALYVHPSDPYNLHWPVRRGRFHLHPGPGGSLSAVVQDLVDIWGAALTSCLEIPVKDLKHYRAVLLIPDLYDRVHLREMLHVLLDRLGFGSAFVVQESVCATFGAGVASACVVDIGDQKTTVSCVEDGLSLKNTRVQMAFGGSDISRVFLWLLKRSGLPYSDCDVSRRVDALFIQEMKETFCHLDQEQYGIEEVFMQIRHPSRNIHKFSMHLADERILAPLSAFIPDMMGLQGAHLVRVPSAYASDPADTRDEDYVRQTMSKHEQAARAIARRKKEAAEGGGPEDSAVLDDDDTMDGLGGGGDTRDGEKAGGGERGGREAEDESKEAEFTKTGGLLGVDQAVLTSIANCESDEVRRRMYSCIVVVGGGLMFSGADSWLKYLIWTQMPAHFRSQLETMDVFTEAKEMDPRFTCWKGGAVMCCLDTAHELWIKKSEWRKEGMKLVRERAPFCLADSSQ